MLREGTEGDNTHCGGPIKIKSSLLCLAASPIPCRNGNSLRIFSCKDTKEKKKVNAFEYSFLSYLVLLCLSPLRERRNVCGALTKSLCVIPNNRT